MLLSGVVDPPEWAEPLIKALESCNGLPGTRTWIQDEHSRNPDQPYAFASPSPQPSPSPSNPSRTPSFLRRKKPKSPFPPPHWGSSKDGGSYFSEDAATTPFDDRVTNNFETRFDNGLQQPSTRSSFHNPVVAHKTSNTLVGDLDDPFDNVHGQMTSNVQTSRGHTPRATSLGGNFKFSPSAPASRSQSTYGTPFSRDDFSSSSPFSNTLQKLSHTSPTTQKSESTQPPPSGERAANRAIARFDFNAVEVTICQASLS